MTLFALILILSILGISETFYLIRKRMASEKPICPMGGNCDLVLESKYNKIFIIHNDTWGFLGYIVIAMVTLFALLGISPTDFWILTIKILVASASVISLFFTYLQWQVIRVWCFWCLMSACTIWLMGILILVMM